MSGCIFSSENYNDDWMEAAETHLCAAEKRGFYHACEFSTLRLLFRVTYNEYLATIRDQLGHKIPFILVDGGFITLLKDGHEYSFKQWDEKFWDLAQFAHVPLILHLLLNRFVDQPLPERTYQRLFRFRDEIGRALDCLVKFDFSGEMRENFQFQISKTIELVDVVLASRVVRTPQLQNFSRDLADAVQFAADYPVADLIEYHQRALEGIRPLLSEREWQKIKIAINGSPSGRRESLTVQFFSKVFDVKGENSTRIYYFEGCFEEQGRAKTVHNLARHITEESFSRDLLQDPKAMQSDLQGMRADEILETMKQRIDALNGDFSRPCEPDCYHFSARVGEQ